MRDAALITLSFPKSGRTWHRVMLGFYLSRLTGAPAKKAMDVSGLAQDLGVGSITYSHNNANFTDGLAPDDPEVANGSVWEGRQVLLIVREPRDVLVSAYHHARFRDRIFNGSISDFVRAPQTGIDKVLTALNRWHDQRHRAARFDVISYEGMHRDPVDALSVTVRALGLEPDPTLLADAIEFSTFEKMKEYERSNYLADGRLGNTGGTEQAAKVREGRIGGYASYLSPDDLAFIAARATALRDPFASYY